MNRTGKPTYIGRYYHALEQKGRLSIPASFRTQLNGKAILTAGLDGCLFLLDETSWDTLLSNSYPGPLTKKTHRDWARFLANNAAKVDIDSQGRILIPETLRQLANLTADTVIVGSIDRIEIWDQVTYHTYLDDLNQNAASIAENII